MQSLDDAPGGYHVSSDPALFDVDVFHRFLSRESYWAKGRLLETTRRVLAHSLAFGLFAPTKEMVGAARVVTDHGTFAWICDVFVLEAHRGKGLGKLLMASVMEHPSVRDAKRAFLGTADAHGFYGSFGFAKPERPERLMMRRGTTL